MTRSVVLFLLSAVVVCGQKYFSPVDVKLTHDGKRLYVLCPGYG
jgi:hypothetical protein